MFTFLLVGFCSVFIVLCYRALLRIEQSLQPPPSRPEVPVTVEYEQPATIKFPGVLLALLSVWLASSVATAAEPVQMMHLSPLTRSWYRNPDGSCVQCSLGMCGCQSNDENAATLLWDTEYGPAVRGGSGPSRVERYCDQRGIKVWSVTGASVDETMPWLEWAARTGRFAAIGAGQQHFQTLYGFDPNTRTWYVCNNNSTNQIDRYTDQEMRALHAASGPWLVVLEKPSSVPPQIIKWWK